MSTLRLRRLEALIALSWLAILVTSLWLWHVLADPSALPPPQSLASRALALLGRVPYGDPALVARVRVTRIAVIAAFGSLALVGLLERARVKRAVQRFVTTPSHPLNLAVFRIVLLWQAWSLAYFDYVSRIAALPDGLQFPPATTVPAIGPLAVLAYWPRHVLTPEQVELAGKVMVAACVTGILGVFSRASLLVVAVVLFYGWGALQWYGKVDHHHHVLWFALVLAASPCGDALSIDSLVRSWRRRRRRSSEPPPAEDVAYGLPLQICMLLMGVLYFFPGFWKIWRSGFDWFLGDNPFNQIYIKWHMLGRWLPGFRIDQHPLLVRAGALGTILFELSFIFLIFGRVTRYVAAVMGVTFHTSLNVLMRHGFETLRNCYVIFVDWHALFGWLRYRILPRGVVVAVGGPHARASLREPARMPRSPTTLGVLAQKRVAGTALVGGALIAANVWAGALRMQDAWPTACYPLFDGLVGDSYTTLQIKMVAEDGSERTLNAQDYRNTFGDRWTHLLFHILEERNEERRRELLRLIWDVMAREDPSLARSRHIRFFKVRSWIHPDQWQRPSGDPELIYEVTL